MSKTAIHTLDNVILAIDPGEGTGIAWTSLEWTAKSGHEVSWTEVHDEQNSFYDQPIQWSVLRTLGVIQRTRASVVVVEDNAALVVSPMMRGRLTKSSLIPVRFEAMLSFALAQKWSPIEYVRQGPSDKNVMTNDRLRRLGCLPEAKMPHARDAVRHLVVALDRRHSRRR
jgi:hypothetical protein